jgi:hypothetical protein
MGGGAEEKGLEVEACLETRGAHDEHGQEARRDGEPLCGGPLYHKDTSSGEEICSPSGCDESLPEGWRLRRRRSRAQIMSMAPVIDTIAWRHRNVVE